VKTYSRFSAALSSLSNEMRDRAQLIHTEKWQSIDISTNPQAAMVELTNVTFSVPLGSEDLDTYRAEIKPNLPWADDHFETERVNRRPLNPGDTYRYWPWASSAEKFRTADQQFSHTYAERFWPKHAGPTFSPDGNITGHSYQPHRGVRYPYGDLQDVAKLLGREPYTRQAYLPIWFPEDTGVVHGARVPCTLGYHFLMRDNMLNVFYPIRSCDFARHLRDDLYLTVRLTLWMLSQCRTQNPKIFDSVQPGLLSFWAGSLHMFVADYQRLYKRNPLAPSRVNRG